MRVYKHAFVSAAISVICAKSAWADNTALDSMISAAPYMGWVVALVVIFFAWRRNKSPAEVNPKLDTARFENDSKYRGSPELAQDGKKKEDELARLCMAIERATDTVIITDPEGIIVYANPAFETLSGYKREEVLGVTPRILKSGEHDEEFYRNLWDTIKKGEVWSGVITNRRKDGGLYEEATSITPVMDAEGRIINFVSVKQDVTARVTLEKARTYFTSVTSHELRTPVSKLALLKLMLSELEDSAPDNSMLTNARHVVEDVFASLNRLATVTGLLNELNHPASERIMLPINLVEEARRSMKDAEAAAEKSKRNINIKLENATGEPVIVHAVPQMIHHAFNEVFSNAIKYTPDGKSVNAHVSGNGEWASVEISDEGVGIKPGMQHAILEPYFSSENPLHHSSSRYKFGGGGIGLGLTVTNMIMKFHGGSLDIHNNGRGGTLILKFPIKKV